MTSARPSPPRGTRPRNRRDLIREAAAALFAERGYSRVSLDDIAATVNVGRSALYRHFPNKATLLYEATDVGLTQVLDGLRTGGAGLTVAVGSLAGNVLENRSVGVLWQREARNLPQDLRQRLRAKVREGNRVLAAALRIERPELTAGQADLLASCAVDAATSVSFHRLTLPRATFVALLTDLCLRVLQLPMPEASDPGSSSQRQAGMQRSDELIDASVRLFAEHGYGAVSIDDIGAAVGIAGPSVYKHFDSKHDLLREAMVRGTTRLLADLATASAGNADPAVKLRRISDAYVTLALDDSDLIGTLIAETMHLDDASRTRTRKVQRSVIDDWVTLALTCWPNDDPTVARIKVQAAQMVANDIGRTPHLRKVPGFTQIVLDVCWELQQ